jgi:predicted ATPase
MAEALLRASATVRVLATSREPLRAEGECLYRVPPLSVPTQDAQDVAELLRHGAVRLFVARASATDPRFAPDGDIAVAAAAICRRLDGIPLAIELAASRGGILGVAEIAARLDDRFHVLTGGRRTALPRHRTLRATLDWSYELLSERERIVLRRLAVFVGGITLEAATAVVTNAEVIAADLVECVAELVEKSLVTPDTGGISAQYRLLETTRAYAIEKLMESGEIGSVARRHAEYYRDLFERAEALWDTPPTAERVAALGRQADNLRAALDWAFSPGGDPSIGVALTATAVPLWMHFLLLDECRRRTELALAHLGSGSSRETRVEMKLSAALAMSLMQTESPARAGATWSQTLGLAESLDDAEHQLRALWGLWSYRIMLGEYGAALTLAQRFSTLATKLAYPTDLSIGDRMIGLLLHYRGDQARARDYIERVFTRQTAPLRGLGAIRFHFDHRVLARVTLARILWLQGFANRAMSTAQKSVEDAQDTGQSMSLCNALAHAACPVALFVGDLPSAERSLSMLLEHSARHALPVWSARGHCLKGVLLIKRGDIDTVHGFSIPPLTSLVRPDRRCTTRHFLLWPTALPIRGKCPKDLR